MDAILAAFKRSIHVRPEERRGLILSFLMFFAVLASYFTIRPLREALGAGLHGGPGELFTIVFLVMIALVPVFGLIATRLPRRFVLPSIYAFFVSNLVVFAVLMHTGTTPLIASCFFVWVTVYNVFAVSLFWSLMSDNWGSDQGKRLFGVIAAGGTLGSIAGPVLADRLVHLEAVGTANLPLVSAAFLTLALIASLELGREPAPTAAPTDTPPVTQAAVFDGALRILASPYLIRIALFIFLANVVSTYFYLEQARLVKVAFPDDPARKATVDAARVAFFAGRDLMVSLATAAIQLFGTAQVLTRFGLTAALAALPAVCIAGLLGIGIEPTLGVVAGVMVVERITAFALAGPAMRVLYTVVDPDEKYKAQNFIDTVVFRGGDATAGWLFTLFGKTLALSAAATIAATLPFAAVWLAASLGLGRLHQQKAREGE